VFARRSQFFGVRYLLQDLALTAVAFPVAYWIRAHILTRVLGFGPIYPIQSYWPLLLGMLLLWPVVGGLLGTYRRIDPRKRLQLARDAFGPLTLGSLFVLAGLYLAHGQYISRPLVVVLWAVDATFVVAGRLFAFSADSWLRRRMEWFRYFLIVGTGTAARELGSFIQQGEALGDRLIGYAYTGLQPPPDLAGAYRVLPVKAVPDLIEAQPVDEVVFAVSREEIGSLEALLRRCQEEGVHTRVHLDFLPLNVSRVYLEHLRDVPLLTFASAPYNEVLLALKRGLDLLLAAAATLLLAPLLLAIGLLIRCTSPGPAIYRQTRCGVGGRRFTLYKFRSMVADADRLRPALDVYNEAEGPVFKMRNDPRVTPVGHWLRKFSLDELPQLWNVIRGDMSLVGPRPPLPDEVLQYEKWQRRRLRMRPGLTCLWALEGRSGVKFDRWMELDLAYIDNWSLWLDAKIFLKTIPYVFRGHGAF
jgi:exopolysaccharide biosynthesis polyprenyl glycosylphosphotransferase